MNGEKWPLVTSEPIEFEKWQVEDFNKIIDHIRGIYVMYVKSLKKNQKITKHN